MRLPIKLNCAGWPPSFARLFFAYDDPRPLASPDLRNLSAPQFSRAISTLNFGVNFKKTFAGRQKHSDRFVSDLYRGLKPVILDVGASDGSTSLDLIKALNGDFSRYFVTDLNLFASCGHSSRGVVYFLNSEGVCTLRASRRFIAYSETRGARFPLSFLARYLISLSGDVHDWRKVFLIQPELISLAERDPRICIMHYDLYRQWPGDQPDLIKVANLLNPRYLSEGQIKDALTIQCSNLGINGRLLLVSEDGDVEKLSVFRKTPAGMLLEHTHAGGVKAAGFVPNASHATPQSTHPAWTDSRSQPFTSRVK
jgi:hypothetical protein